MVIALVGDTRGRDVGNKYQFEDWMVLSVLNLILSPSSREWGP